MTDKDISVEKAAILWDDISCPICGNNDLRELENNVWQCKDCGLKIDYIVLSEAIDEEEVEPEILKERVKTYKIRHTDIDLDEID